MGLAVCLVILFLLLNVLTVTRKRWEHDLTLLVPVMLSAVLPATYEARTG